MPESLIAAWPPRYRFTCRETDVSPRTDSKQSKLRQSPLRRVITRHPSGKKIIGEFSCRLVVDRSLVVTEVLCRTFAVLREFMHFHIRPVIVGMVADCLAPALSDLQRRTAVVGVDFLVVLVRAQPDRKLCWWVLTVQPRASSTCKLMNTARTLISISWERGMSDAGQPNRL